MTPADAAAPREPQTASRVPSGGFSPRLYFPLSRPEASGKKGRNPRPKCSQEGSTSCSTLRSSSEKRFCAETKRVPPAAVQSASAICQPVKLELPM